MAIIKSNWVTNTQPMPIPAGSEVVNVLLSLPVKAAETALNDIYAMGYLPADCVLVDAVFAASSIDSAGSKTHAMSFGVLQDDLADLDGTALQTAVQVGRAGTAARLTPTPATLTAKAPSNKGSPLGYKVTTASATGAAGVVHLSLSYRAVAHGA